MNKYLAMLCLSLVALNCGAEDADLAQIHKAVHDYLLFKSPPKFGAYTKLNNIGACVSVKLIDRNKEYTEDAEASLLKVYGVWKVTSIQNTTHEECIKFMLDVAGKLSKLGPQQK